ncbi:hypothetical protein [Flavobacterium sp. 9AF]|uniref:hypothetical protein n=1 Tax=Flavobacterium sp. 9AF TaxID=2653142 RepID=UPI001356ADE6|nr:hypothetical protein [Flavobacterium sp. 9AF]
MKKKLEAELISIAHRVLKLKNRSETKQLQEEAKKLYEQLTILRFYEENFEAIKDQVSQEELEAKLEAPVVVEEVKRATPIVTEAPVEMKEEVVEEVEEMEEEPILKEEEQKEQPALFEGVFMNDYKEVDFVKVEDLPKEIEKIADVSFEKIETTSPVKEVIEEPIKEIIEAIQPEKIESETIFEAKKTFDEEPRTLSLNDRLTRGISFGLNDRIAFEKRLFGGSAQDFNRVLSQLNTFDSFEEAKDFINDFVKPDYDNWEGKEEYETRFLEIIERKFN